MWFIMNLGVRLDDRALIDKAVKIALNTAEYGCTRVQVFTDRSTRSWKWTRSPGSISELTIAMTEGYQPNFRLKECLEWFGKLHEYTWAHFKDTEHPEWFGYLNRRGEVLLPLKGGK